MTNNQVSNSNPNWKVTIGMPVFNVANYIAASLTSALEQDMDGIEILAIRVFQYFLYIYPVPHLQSCGTVNLLQKIQSRHISVSLLK